MHFYAQECQDFFLVCFKIFELLWIVVENFWNFENHNFLFENLG